MKRSIKNNISKISAVVALSLASSTLWAKTLDSNLQSAMNNASDEALHQVIISFEGNSSPNAAQLNALESLGISGISMKSLPIVGALATKSQIEAIYARDDVISVWNNAELQYENHDATQLTGVQELRMDSTMRNLGMPFSGRGIGVVVNDSGVDGTHGDIKYPNHVVQNVLAQTNLNSLSDILPITYQEDVANTDIAGGHGTHVAGTIGGNGSMSSGKHAGVAPGAKIIGYGSGAGLFILDTLGGFDYALTHQFDYNIRVISNSFGSTSDVGSDFNPDHPTNIATKALADRGVIVVFSAGNSGSGESTITGNFKKAPWVVTVAAGDKDGNLADFSSRGVKGKGGVVSINGEEFEWEDRPTVTAPGVDIISARASLSSLSALSIADDSEVLPANEVPYYTLSSGTSMSAPHVSGIVALMLEANPSLDWRGVKTILQDTATNMSGRDAWEVGAGYVNAYAAVKAAVEMDGRFGDTVKLNRDFNAFANISVGDEFDRTVSFSPVGEAPAETFNVGSDISMVTVRANVSDNTVALVLEDPMGNRYGSGISLPVLGQNIATAAPGMAGEWKVYARGIGSISGVPLDPLGVTNGTALPGEVTATIKLLKTDGYTGIDDAQGHPGQSFIEYAISEHLMDATPNGFLPNRIVTREEFADVLTLSGAIRQDNRGNTRAYRDVKASLRGAVNAVAADGSALKDRGYEQGPVMKANSSDTFGAKQSLQNQEVAYSLIQSLGLEADAEAAFAETLTVNAFGQTVEVVDSDMIADEFKGHVQLALDLGLMGVEYDISMGQFDPNPVITARFEPVKGVNRAKLAMFVSKLHILMGQ